MKEAAFEAWIETLRTDVIQDEFGYEDGEFTVYAEQWRPLFNKGLTPLEAFQRALDGFERQRREDEEARQANWKRIQAADAKYKARP